MDEDLSRDHSVDGKDMNGNASRDRPVDRVTVPEAAEMMGVTQSAIRKRIHRGTIPWDKDHEGRIYVYVDPSEMSPETRGGKARDTSAGQSRDELLEAYRDQVEFLRRELERKDTIIMSLMQRVPELETRQRLLLRDARRLRDGLRAGGQRYATPGAAGALRDANLGDAEMTYCSFYRTKLRGADLRKATFVMQGQIEEAVGDRHTRLSSPLHTPKAWSLSFEEQLERLKELDSELT